MCRILLVGKHGLLVGINGILRQHLHKKKQFSKKQFSLKKQFSKKLVINYFSTIVCDILNFYEEGPTLCWDDPAVLVARPRTPRMRPGRLAVMATEGAARPRRCPRRLPNYGEECHRHHSKSRNSHCR